MLNVTKLLIILLAVSGFCSGAYGHSKVTTTQPENGAILTEIPTTIGLKFGNKIRLTKVAIQRDEQATIDLDLGQYKGFEKSFVLSNTSQGKGLYSIEWRGLSIDGHVMQGSFTFTVE